LPRRLLPQCTSFRGRRARHTSLQTYCWPNALPAANAAKVSTQAYARNATPATPPHAPATLVKQLWQPVHSFCSVVAAATEARFCRASAAFLPVDGDNRYRCGRCLPQTLCTVTLIRYYVPIQELSMFYAMSLGAQRLATVQEKVRSLYAHASHGSATAVACCCTRA